MLVFLVGGGAQGDSESITEEPISVEQEVVEPLSVDDDIRGMIVDTFKEDFVDFELEEIDVVDLAKSTEIRGLVLFHFAGLYQHFLLGHLSLTYSN